MPLPGAVARFNRRYTNRFIEPVVRRSAGFALVHHRGRRTGRRYRTPVNVFDLDDGAERRLVVALTYGPTADWVQNVSAGPAHLTRRGTDLRVVAIEIVGRDVAWPILPLAVRAVLRLLRVRDFALLSVGA
jgi:deazaflavin-dependent oxidoreductase (nitroreductase family)